MPDYSNLSVRTFTPTAVSSFNGDTGGIGTLTADVDGAVFSCTAAVPIGWYKRYVYWQYTIPAEIVASAKYAYISMVVYPDSLLTQGGYWQYQLCPLTPPESVAVQTYTGLTLGVNTYPLLDSEIPNLADPTFAFSLMVWSQHADSSNPLLVDVAAPVVTIYYDAPVEHTLTVESVNPSSGVPIAIGRVDTNGDLDGVTSFTRRYYEGAVVAATAPSTVGGNTFSSWTGDGTATGAVDSVTMDADKTIVANYTTPSDNGGGGDDNEPPSGTPKVLMLDYRFAETANEIEARDSVRVSPYTGKMLVIELSRKFSPWTVPALGGGTITTDNGPTPVFGDGSGRVYSLKRGQYHDDDYGIIGGTTPAYYVTSPFVNAELEQALQLGNHRHLFTYLTVFVSGVGKLVITPLADRLGNTWPQRGPYDLTLDPDKELEIPLDVAAMRAFFRFHAIPLTGSQDSFFSVSRMVVTMKNHPMSPVRGAI